MLFWNIIWKKFETFIFFHGLIIWIDKGRTFSISMHYSVKEIVLLTGNSWKLAPSSVTVILMAALLFVLSRS